MKGRAAHPALPDNDRALRAALLRAVVVGLVAAGLCTMSGSAPEPAERVLLQECMASPLRAVEALGADTVFSGARAGAALGLREVPPVLLQAFDRLVRAARLPAGVVPLLRPYRDTFPNARSGLDGNVWIASAFWEPGSPFEPADVAATLAHEIAHLEGRDTLRAGCTALALAGLPQARLAAVHWQAAQAARGNEALARRLLAAAHQMELEADWRGRQLLQQAGLDPQSMVRQLRALDQHAHAGPALSHPDTAERIRALSLR